MGYSIGINSEGRDIGYAVPSTCDHPDCNEKIDRGMSYVCAGCEQYFCGAHLWENGHDQLCKACGEGEPPFPVKPDTLEWCMWKLEDRSWMAWRVDNPDKAREMRDRVNKAALAAVPFDCNLERYEHREPTIVIDDSGPKGCWVATWTWVPAEEMKDV